MGSDPPISKAESGSLPGAIRRCLMLQPACHIFIRSDSNSAFEKYTLLLDFTLSSTAPVSASSQARRGLRASVLILSPEHWHFAGAEGLGDFAGFEELLEKLVHLGCVCAAAAGDALASLAIDLVRVAPFPGGHGEHDCLRLIKEGLIDVIDIELGLDLAESRKHANELPQRAHLSDLTQLFNEVLEVEGPLLHLLAELVGVLVADGLLGFFDQRKHVAHAEDATGEAVRVERLEGIRLL